MSRAFLLAVLIMGVLFVVSCSTQDKTTISPTPAIFEGEEGFITNSTTLA